jgi:hypothetical protein
MLCHSVGSGTPGQTQSATQSDTSNIAGWSYHALIRVYDKENVIETTPASGRVLNVHKIRFNPDNNR